MKFLKVSFIFLYIIYRQCYLRGVGAIATNSELLSNWVSPMHLPVGVLPVLYEDNIKYGLGRLYSFVFLNDLVILPNNSISRSIISAPNKNNTNNTVIEHIMIQYSTISKNSFSNSNTILLPQLQKQQM